ncbi:arsenate reductase/protein-tyrosine-phosphatase family protein [Streptomyces mesophilus]|uniref:arsenate reductase/protein-tyrosine-phosphatase family protein n=1 Tax=Streptomyces mesophilus TaxID=1775132 RepID=UPI0019D216E8|nr:low molecular weight phosphatase family protein [Streptomyces mesophilus]
MARLRVLFVCTGNVHRSVLAERLFAKWAPDAEASSAGTQARHLEGMDAATRSVLAGLGGEVGAFASRPLTAALAAGSDLVLGMEREHREAAVRLEPQAMRRCFTLKEFLRLAADLDGAGATPEETVARVAALRGRVAPASQRADAIPDPWGQGYDVLRDCATGIDEAVRELSGVLGVRGGVLGREVT